MTLNPVAESVKAALDGVRAMIANSTRTAEDLRAQANILSAVLVATIKELGAAAAVKERDLVDHLLEKGRAAGVGVRPGEVGEQIEQLQRLLAMAERELELLADADRAAAAIRGLAGGRKRRRR